MQTHAANHQWESASRVNQKENYIVIFQIKSFIFLYLFKSHILSLSSLLETIIVATWGATVTNFHLKWVEPSQHNLYFSRRRFYLVFTYQGGEERLNVFFWLSNSNVEKVVLVFVLVFFCKEWNIPWYSTDDLTKKVWSQSFQNDISGNESLLRTWREIPGPKCEDYPETEY